MNKEKIIKEMKDFSKSYANIPEYMYSLDLDKVEILLGYINTLEQQLKKKDEVIEKTVEYIWRSEVNSIGTPFAYTDRGKDLLKILKGDSNVKTNKENN